MSTVIAKTEPETQGYTIDREAVLRSLGLNLKDVNAQTLLLTCERYGLDPILKHMVLIQGRPYVTRDGLLHVAHRSGQLDGIEVLEQDETTTHHVAKVAVYRKDMGRPFTYIGRYPKAGSNKAYGPEMAVKCAEVMALRRAFDVGLCAREELWDQEADEAPIQAQARSLPPVPGEPEPEAEPMPSRPAPRPTPRPQTEATDSARLVEDYKQWLVATVERINGLWKEHWTSATGEVDPGITYLLNTYQVTSHLFKWLVEENQIRGGDTMTIIQKERLVAGIWGRTPKKVQKEAEDYGRKLWRSSEQEMNQEDNPEPENESQEVPEEIASKP